MRIYDCITYFDEEVLLNFRLNLLNKYVDKFVIVECKYTHRGIKKNFNLDLKKLRNLKIKLFILKLLKNPLI